jgi:hypothetical protein
LPLHELYEQIRYILRTMYIKFLRARNENKSFNMEQSRCE